MNSVGSSNAPDRDGGSSPARFPGGGTSAVLEVDGCSKRFPGALALDGVSLTLQRGEVHALVGENGAGKSTLIKVITGVHAPDDGEVRLEGRRVDFSGPRAAQAAGVSTIFQEVNLVPQMSVARNLFLEREPRRFGILDVGAMNEAAAATLAGHGITVDPRRPLAELGLGVQQMVAIARAVSMDARVVIMDEPTSSLEAAEVERLFAVIRGLRDRGVAVLYVSHKLGEIFTLCQAVTVLRDGRRVHHGPVGELDRLGLIAHMLGRSTSEVSAAGMTRFGGGRRVAGGEAVLHAEGLSRRHVLHDISLSVSAGEVVGLAGLLGSGRTETAKAVYGAQPLDQGVVSVNKRRLRKRSPAASIRAGIGMISEDRKAEGIIPEFTIRENITLSSLKRVSRGGFISRRREKALVAQYFGRLAIRASGPEQQIGQLSGGNQQKVLLARMLAMNPKVLILDEPTRGIDVGAKAEIQSLVDGLAGEHGVGIILISSELEEIVEGADTVVVLRDGAVAGTLRGPEISEERIMSLIAHAGDDAGQEARP